MIPACQAYGLGLIPWSPLAGGLLGGASKARPRGGGPRRISGRASRSTARSSRRTRRSAASSARSPADVALAWLLRNPAVTAPIIGPRTMEQLEGSLRALDVPLDRRVLERLDAIWPGPGGPAPEAYAW